MMKANRERTNRARRILASMALILAGLALVGVAHAAGEDAPASAPLSATTVFYQVNERSDDAVQDGPTFYPFNTSLTLGDNGTVSHYVGIRFTGVNIPQGAVITEAHLEFTAWTNTGGPAMMLIRGHDVGDSPTFSTSDGPMDRMSQANTPVVTWSPVDWAWEGSYTTPDLAPILQQIIDRPDWSAGNAVTLLLSDGGGLTGGERVAYSYDRDAAKAPRLLTTYEGLSTASIIDPGFLGLVGQVDAQPRPDLAVTSVTTDRAGYRAESEYEITVEVTNLGLEPSGAIQVEATIERAIPLLGLSIGPIVGSSVVPITFSSAASLSPGQTVVLQSGPRPLDPDVFTESLSGGWVPGVPNNSTIYVRATVQPASDETLLENNTALATFLFPTGPADPDYDPLNDSDLDGWEDDDEMNCYLSPQAYPGGIDLPDDGDDGDCAFGDNRSGWALTGKPAQGFADNPAPDSDSDGDGFTANQGDCWEGPNPPGDIAYPGATDVPDGYDNDCDGEIDEDYSIDLYEGDLDGDGVSVAEGDCDDLNGSIRPGASELADGIDNNCDGFIDEGHRTPDWAITNFQVTPQDSECVRFTHPELWEENTLCGLQFELEIENVGEDLGPVALEVVRNSAYVTDLVRDYGIPPSGSIMYPYTTWQPWELMELMACGPIGFIAVIPAADGQGQIGESNLLNNQAIAYPPSFEQDVDIQFETGSGADIRYPDQFAVQLGNLSILTIEPASTILGGCPPPALIDFWTRVRVYQNDNLILDETSLQVDSNIENPFHINLDPRPANGDSIRIEILLNSDGMVTEQDMNNNLCILEFVYDRAGLGSSRVNDRLVFTGGGGCTARLISSDGSTTIGTSQGALIGGSPSPAILTGGLLLGAIGGLLGWRYTTGAGRSVMGVLAGAGAGIVSGGAVGALGVYLIVRFTAPVETHPDLTEPLAATGIQLPERPAVERISDLWSGSEPISCAALLEPFTEVAVDQDGHLADVLLGWNASMDQSGEGRFRITIWDASASPHEAVLDAPPLSVAQEGLLDVVGENLVWQLALEEMIGGDLFLDRCVPSFQQLSLFEYRLAQQIKEKIGDAPLFGGCDPDDPECHVRVRLEFQNGQPLVALDVSILEQVVSQAQETDLVFETELSYSQSGVLVAGPLGQMDRLAQLKPGDEGILFDDVRYIPFTIRSKVPAELRGIVSLEGSLHLTFGTGELALGRLPIRADDLDLSPPPTPTPVPTPTPTATPPPDKTGPKVGGVNDSLDPIYTNGNKPDTTTVSATVTDPSGIASVTLYYRVGSKGAFQVWGPMSGSGGNYSVVFGPFGSAGTYQYRIYAVDGLGNANCSPGDIAACPGGTLTVTIP